MDSISKVFKPNRPVGRIKRQLGEKFNKASLAKKAYWSAAKLATGLAGLGELYKVQYYTLRHWSGATRYERRQARYVLGSTFGAAAVLATFIYGNHSLNAAQNKRDALAAAVTEGKTGIICDEIEIPAGTIKGTDDPRNRVIANMIRRGACRDPALK